MLVFTVVFYANAYPLLVKRADGNCSSNGAILATTRDALMHTRYSSPKCLRISREVFQLIAIFIIRPTCIVGRPFSGIIRLRPVMVRGRGESNLSENLGMFGPLYPNSPCGPYPYWDWDEQGLAHVCCTVVCGALLSWAEGRMCMH